jgi:hypothetical protein
MGPTNKLSSLVRTRLERRLNPLWLVKQIVAEVDKRVDDVYGIVQRRFRELASEAVDVLIEDDKFVAGVIARAYKEVEGQKSTEVPPFTAPFGAVPPHPRVVRKHNPRRGGMHIHFCLYKSF